MDDPNAAPRRALRLLGWILLGYTVFFAAETLIELHRTGAAWSDLRPSPDAARSLSTTVSRAFNNLLAMVLAFVSLAVPITANMYTPKLVEMFFADRVNLGGLVFFAAMGAHAIFTQWILVDAWTPSTHVTVLWLSGVLGFALVVPYYLYVLDFLNPTTIVRRVRDRVVDAYPDGGAVDEAAQVRLADRVLQLGNVILRSVDRADRDVALQAIRALEDALFAYDAPKRRAPSLWFAIPRDLFPGLATEAVALIRRERNWVEHACLRQLHLAYLSALARMPDAGSAISQVNRRIAVHALRGGDDATLGLTIRFFNTFVRAALGKRDVHAVYDVFRQYRALAIEMLSARPERSLAIVRHLRYYGDLAASQGLPFVREVAVADVAAIVEAAYRANVAAAPQALAEMRRFRNPDPSVRVVKAEAALAVWLRENGRRDDETQVLRDLAAAPPAVLEQAKRDLAGADDPVFWEVTDRQRNLDWLAPDRRAQVLALLDEVTTRRDA